VWTLRETDNVVETMTTTEDPTVLLVDDEPDLLDVYELWLDGSCEVRTASGGDEALEAVDEAVDVVFLDRRMPGMAGDEVLAEVRARGYDPQVAMLTAVDPSADIVDLPFDDYLTKPVSQTELESVIDILLQRAEYDERSRELFALASKRAALEASPEVDHRSSAEYQELTAELRTLREEVDESLDELLDHDYETAFREV
jgi:two-component system OmpR family response regulator